MIIHSICYSLSIQACPHGGQSGRKVKRKKDTLLKLSFICQMSCVIWTRRGWLLTIPPMPCTWC